MRYVSTRLWNGLSLATHEFTEVGDVLKEHMHGWDGANHMTFVMAGELLCLGAQEGRVVRAGETIEWALREMHGFKALAAPAIILNVRQALEGEMARPRQERPDSV